MSLILDALRKSEAERRRGQAPDLFTGLPATEISQGGGIVRYWPVAALLLLLAVAALWWQRGAGESDAKIQPAAGARPDLPFPDAAMSSAAPEAPVASAERSPPTLPTRASPAAAAVTATAMAADRATAPTPGAANAPTRPATARGAATPAAAAASAPGPTAAASAPPSVAIAPPAPTPIAADNDSSSDAPPPIAVLPISERSALPPLKLSMHVWNSEPGKRFAIIDGQRVTEGSTAGSSIVEEIRRDGVVLNINGRRVLLPRP